MKKLALMLIVLGLTACASVKETLLTTTHTTLLYHEYEASAVAILDLPLQPEAKKTVEDVIAQLDSIRLELGDLHRQGAGKVALTISQSYGYVTRIKELYLKGRAPVIEYYQSSGVKPSAELINYDQSALYAYTAINKQLKDAKNNVDIGEITGLLSLVFRTYAAAHGLPSI